MKKQRVALFLSLLSFQAFGLECFNETETIQFEVDGKNQAILHAKGEKFEGGEIENDDMTFPWYLKNYYQLTDLAGNEAKFSVIKTQSCHGRRVCKLYSEKEINAQLEYLGEETFYECKSQSL